MMDQEKITLLQEIADWAESERQHYLGRGNISAASAFAIVNCRMLQRIADERAK